MKASDKKLTVVFASHTYIGSPFVVGSHHLANSLSDLGHTVFHMSTPVSPAHLVKIKGSTYKARFANWLRGGEVKNRVINYVPFTLIPWNIAKYYRRKNLMYSGCFPQIPSKLKQYGLQQVDLLLIDQYSFIGMEKLVKPAVSIYRATDLYSQMGNDSRIEELEKQMIESVDGIIGTSLPVISNLRKHNEKKPWLLLENGVDYNHFYNKNKLPAEFENLNGPKAIYIGAIDDRLDREAIRSLSKSMPQLNIILIGPCEPADRQYFQSMANVYLLGEVEYANIPYYLNHSDVALLPLSDHPANEGRSPMKLYEYAASGLPVVSKKTKELSRRKEDFVFFYDNHSEIASTVEKIVDYKQYYRDRILHSAKQHSWTYKAEEIIRFARELSSKHTGRDWTRRNIDEGEFVSYRPTGLVKEQY